MKLRNSKTEHDLRVELKRSQLALLNAPDKARLLEVVLKSAPDSVSPFILNWIPEQGEDVYVILADQNCVLTIELDRVNVEEEAVVSKTDVRTYESGLGKHARLKLAIAKSLTSKP